MPSCAVHLSDCNFADAVLAVVPAPLRDRYAPAEVIVPAKLPAVPAVVLITLRN